MAVIFEGTFAELQQRMLTMPLPLEKHVLLVDSVDAMLNAQQPLTDREEGSEIASSGLTLDQIKEMAEDDDEYFLRFYRPS